MASCFSEPRHIEFFSLGFDLIGGQLPESMIEDISIEIEEIIENNPDDREAVLALDALYDAMDERDLAIGTDSNYTFLNTSSVFSLREARHQLLNGEPEEADTLLAEVIRRDLAESPVRQLCALIAWGRRNDRKKFTALWDQLLRQYGAGRKVSQTDIGSLPGEYSLFHDLPFREQIEGIGLLFRFDIRRGREAEILGLIIGFRNYLNNLSESMFEEAVLDGFTDSLPAFRVIAAISSGMVKAAEDILNRGDSIASEVVLEAIPAALDEIRKTGREMLVLETLKHWAFNPVMPAPDLISRLREQSGGDDTLVVAMLDLLDSDRPVGMYHKIRAYFPVPDWKDRTRAEKEPERIRAASLHHDTLGVTEQQALLTPGSEESEDLILNAFLESGREGEAFEYLLGKMKSGNLLTRYTSLFALACTLNRMDDLLQLRPILESRKITAGTYLLDAYGRMMKKDVKGGLALIERAEGCGLPGDEVLLFSARFLLVSGFPKRVEGICVKMFRSGIPYKKVYPLLIRAYRDLGREDDARAAEELSRQIGPRQTGG